MIKEKQAAGIELAKRKGVFTIFLNIRNRLFQRSFTYTI